MATRFIGPPVPVPSPIRFLGPPVPTPSPIRFLGPPVPAPRGRGTRPRPTPQQMSVQRRNSAVAIKTMQGANPSGRLGTITPGRLGAGYINNDWQLAVQKKAPYQMVFDPVFGARIVPRGMKGLGDIPIDTSGSQAPADITPYMVTGTGDDGKGTFVQYGALPPAITGIDMTPPPPPQPPRPGFWDNFKASLDAPLYKGSSLTIGHAAAAGLFLVAMASAGTKRR